LRAARPTGIFAAQEHAATPTRGSVARQLQIARLGLGVVVQMQAAAVAVGELGGEVRHDAAVDQTQRATALQQPAAVTRAIAFKRGAQQRSCIEVGLDAAAFAADGVVLDRDVGEGQAAIGSDGAPVVGLVGLEAAVLRRDRAARFGVDRATRESGAVGPEQHALQMQAHPRPDVDRSAVRGGGMAANQEQVADLDPTLVARDNEVARGVLSVERDAGAIDHGAVAETQTLGRGEGDLDVELATVEADGSAGERGARVELRNRGIERRLGATGAGAVADDGVVGVGAKGSGE
jgi:hypothetical protein